MCTRRRQQAAVEHKGIPGHNGHDSTIAVCLRLSAKVALSDAAEVFAGAIVIEVLNEERLPRLALERHSLAVHHAEPLIEQFDIGGRTRGRLRVVGNALARLGSNREHDSIALVGTRVLRLGDHLRSVRLRELERDLLRRGNAAQRDLVRSALIVGDVEVDGRVRAGLSDRHALEVAALVRRRRDGNTLARSNGDRAVVDRAVDRLDRHLVIDGHVRVIGPGLVRIGARIRIGVIRIGLGGRFWIVGIRIIGVRIRVRVRLIGIGVVRVGNHRVRIDGLLLLFHRQRSGHDHDIEVRIGDIRADLVLARRRILVRVAGVLDLHARGIYRTLQGRGKRRVRLPLVALGVIDFHS